MRPGSICARRLSTATILLLAGVLSAATSNAQVVYSNDFESGSTAGWSTNVTNPVFQRPIGVSVTPSGRAFLGEFGSQSISLDLPSLPRHDTLIVEFDLYVIRSWDGEASSTDGPDIFSASAIGVPTLLRTTFSNKPLLRQNYPAGYPGPTFQARSGAAEVGSLGYGGEDAVYRLRFVFRHTDPQLALTLAATLRDLHPEMANESWGIDNVSITALPPEPASAVLSVIGARARVGEPVQIGIRMHDRVGIEGSGLTAIHMRLRYDASLLLPQAQTPPGTLVGRDRVIDLDLPIVSFDDSLIARLLFKAALGGDTATALSLEDVRGVGDSIALTAVPGRFELYDLCRAGGLRLFRPSAGFLKAPRPSPAASTTLIEVDLPAAAHARVVLLDQGGRAMETIHDGSLDVGSSTFEVDLTNFPSGLYLVVADIAGERWTSSLTVLH